MKKLILLLLILGTIFLAVVVPASSITNVYHSEYSLFTICKTDSDLNLNYKD